MKAVIGLNGFKRSGKNTTGDIIEQLLFRYSVKQVGFADNLKILSGFSLNLGDDGDSDLLQAVDELKEQGELTVASPELPWNHHTTMRSFLQRIGEGARHVLGEDIWLDAVLPPTYPSEAQDHLSRLHPGADVLVITDVRYANEAERIRDYGGDVWEVIRPGTASDGHVSEQPLPRHLITRVIENDKDLSKLRFEVHKSLRASHL